MSITRFSDNGVVGNGNLSPWRSFDGLELRAGGLCTASLAPAAFSTSHITAAPAVDAAPARQIALWTLVVLVADLAKGGLS